MYAKVFGQIYDGTLCTRGPWQALVTFQQLLVLADVEGNVDMTPGAISRRTTIPLDIIEMGLATLIQPDPESRTPTEEGRRIMPLAEGRTWGWRIVNYKHYRDMKREEDRRQYHREYWHKRKARAAASTELNSPQPPQPNQPIEEAEAKAEALNTEPAALVVTTASKRPPACPTEEIIALYHEHLPMLPRAEVISPARKKAISGRWRDVVAEGMSRIEALGLFEAVFKTAARSQFLTGRAPAQKDRQTFRADLDWLMTPKYFPRVAEGRYS